ncbi:hypothetical protein N9953_04210 [Akkermansiaceae bacterium]|nr:hypothetical protein [Akkermansiaceae bacterium]MDB4505272.1 hypothetical protein [bacterium]MDB4314364.1 hypothetical protein [Akkermansiaceae bacterium]MDB4578076.1 hypothetical protein [Akkermansiaceae bacterium]MDB4693650.1 hypothetical protein [Akkermansiaceae bacterium]
MKFLLLMFCVAHVAHGNEFKGLKVDYAARAKFVEQLSEVRLQVVKIEKLNLSAALSKICGGNEEEGKKAIVSYVISFPTRTPSADPFSDDPIEKAKIDPLVSHDGKDVSFTSVLDALCVQAGYVWSISQHEEGWSFVLVEYKDSVK